MEMESDMAYFFAEPPGDYLMRTGRVIVGARVTYPVLIAGEAHGRLSVLIAGEAHAPGEMPPGEILISEARYGSLAPALRRLGYRVGAVPVGADWLRRWQAAPRLTAEPMAGLRYVYPDEIVGGGLARPTEARLGEFGRMYRPAPYVAPIVAGPATTYYYAIEYRFARPLAGRPGRRTGWCFWFRERAARDRWVTAGAVDPAAAGSRERLTSEEIERRAAWTADEAVLLDGDAEALCDDR